jgi:histidyl-tRNA synthetase
MSKLKSIPNSSNEIKTIKPKTSEIQASLGSIFRTEKYLRQRMALESKFDKLALKVGSELIWLPLLNPVDTFVGENCRPLNEKNSIRLLSQALPDGTSVALRYEGTSVATRYATELINNGESDFNCHYMQPMIRIEPNAELDNRHFREFMQFGHERFTTNPLKRIINFVQMAVVNIGFLESLGLKPTFRVSHTGLIAGCLEQCSIDKFAIKRIAKVMENGSSSDITKTLKQCGINTEAQKNLLLLAETRETPISNCIEILIQLESSFRHDLLTGEFKELITVLAKENILEQCLFDPGINRSLGFYNGLTLQIDVPGVKEIAGGGEFSELVTAFGATKEVFASGSAIGVERVLDLGLLGGHDE